MIQLGSGYPLARICIIDDDSDSVGYFKSLLEWSGYQNLIGIEDATKALAGIESYDPDLILLDLYMPEVSGFELLAQIRQIHSSVDYLPIIAITGDTSVSTKTRALDAGATNMIEKPVDALELLLRVRNLLDTRMAHVQLRRYREHLEEEVALRTADLVSAQHGALEALARAAEYRDDNTGEHARRVGDLASEIACALGCGTQCVEMVKLTAPLHDVGKIAVPDSILLKPGTLTDLEYELMKLHASAGAQILSTIHAPEMEMAREIALSHHERWGGRGYPEGIRGEGIPLSARIVAIADVYDALTHERPYKRAWSHQEAVIEIQAQSGHQFDPNCVDAFFLVAEQRGLTGPVF